MANKLYVAEFTQGVSSIGTTGAQFPPQPSIANQIVPIAGVVSAALNAKTQCVMVVSDTACCIKFGAASNVLADNTKDILIPPNVPIMFGAPGGWYISAVAA